MEYKTLDSISVFSLFASAIAVLGIAALTFGPWADPSAGTAYMSLIFSGLAFGEIGLLTRSVRTLLEKQADQIDALQRQIADQRPAA